jgi:hypothetical protein
MIQCIAIIGKRLSSAALTALFNTGCLMVKRRKEKMRVVNDDCNGMVETEFQTVNFGSMTGIQFKADISDDHGPHTVTFIIRDGDYEAVPIQWFRQARGKIVPNDDPEGPDEYNTRTVPVRRYDPSVN